MFHSGRNGWRARLSAVGRQPAVGPFTPGVCLLSNGGRTGSTTRLPFDHPKETSFLRISTAAIQGKCTFYRRPAERILTDIGEPPRPPPIAPARGPPRRLG